MQKPNKKKYLKMLGRREWIFFPEWNFGPVEAKIDTGAYTGSLHAECIREQSDASGKKSLYFQLSKDFYTFLQENLIVHSYFFERKPIKNSFGEEEVRYVIPVKIKVGKKIIKTKISLTDRSTMKYQVLLGRRVIKNKFLLDVGKIMLNGRKVRIC